MTVDGFFHAHTRILPVVTRLDRADAGRLATALHAAGLPCAEVTLRSADAIEVIRDLAQDPAFVVGAGTVTRVEQVAAAVDAGARYIVSPGLSRSVVQECAVLGIPMIPGVATATEVQCALDEGVTTMKLFPAAVLGGPEMVRALSAPFPDVRFVPTGGITSVSAPGYLALTSVEAVGGSWIVAPDVLPDFARVTDLALQARAMAEAVGR